MVRAGLDGAASATWCQLKRILGATEFQEVSERVTGAMPGLPAGAISFWFTVRDAKLGSFFIGAVRQHEAEPENSVTLWLMSYHGEHLYFRDYTEFQAQVAQLSARRLSRR